LICFTRTTCNTTISITLWTEEIHRNFSILHIKTSIHIEGRETIPYKIKLVMIITKSDIKNLNVESNVIQQILTCENYGKWIIHQKICQSDSPWHWWHSTRCFVIRTSTALLPYIIHYIRISHKKCFFCVHNCHVCSHSTYESHM
jgi:hypothetical protein